MSTRFTGMFIFTHSWLWLVFAAILYAIMSNFNNIPGWMWAVIVAYCLAFGWMLFSLPFAVYKWRADLRAARMQAPDQPRKFRFLSLRKRK